VKVIVSFSGGKDSTWMLLEMIRRGEHIDEVVFFDTGWEYPQMLRHVAKIKRLVEEHGIVFTTLHPEKPFDYWMFEHPKSNGGKGWSWCGKNNCRWGTTWKIDTINKHFATEPEHTQCVGIAADETGRLLKERKGNKRFPLAEWGITEAECLQGCYSLGYDWEGLYEQLDRVSCKFCGLKNLKELRNIHANMPDVWEELRDYQSRTHLPYRKEGWTIFDLEKRFALEKEFEAAGKSTRGREFHTALKQKLSEH
jgi:3'-phosphoadenosine 5'-phosphosulfate sulfotransferase (PAPS reductase)/FAD synthetase